MCLGHVYIVLEPVGSARLTFDDDLYYELCVLMTEVCLESRMRSRTYEESRNGREVKIHILEGYIQILERFRVIRVFFGVPGSYGNSPGEVMGLIGPYGKGGGMPKGRWRPPRIQIGLGEGDSAPLPFPTPSLFPSFLLPCSEKEKGFLLGLRSPNRTPYAWHAPRRAGLSPSLLYIRGQGAPQRHSKICLSRVRCPPPQLHTSVISS